jgi:hypothetical protein
MKSEDAILAPAVKPEKTLKRLVVDKSDSPKPG